MRDLNPRPLLVRVLRSHCANRPFELPASGQRAHSSRERRGAAQPRRLRTSSWCPQKNSNLRFRLERAASLATRRWGRTGHSPASRDGSPTFHRHEASGAPSLLHRLPRKPTRRLQVLFTLKGHDTDIDVEHFGLAGSKATSLLHGSKTRPRAGLSASLGRHDWTRRTLGIRRRRAAPPVSLCLLEPLDKRICVGNPYDVPDSSLCVTPAFENLGKEKGCGCELAGGDSNA